MYQSENNKNNKCLFSTFAIYIFDVKTGLCVIEQQINC